MKPLKIEISGIGPYADKAFVDLIKFSGQGVFLITGDTGAGKTTIFDAIAFALFGEASGSIRTVDTMRSDFADAFTKTYVELTFSHKGKEYNIIRNPKYERPKKSGQGVTTESADAVLTLPTKDVVTGYKDVTTKVVDILGITYRQFKQIAMIAQGEFLQLLLADSKERGEIFRKVFNTEFYQTVQRMLKDKEKQAYRRCTETEHSILQYIKSIILPDQESSLKLKTMIAEATIHSAVDISNELKAFIKEEQHRKTVLLKQSEEIQIKQEKHIQKITNAIHNNELFQELYQANQMNDKLAVEFPEYEQNKLKYRLGEKALNTVFPYEKSYIREKESVEKLKENQVRLDQELANKLEAFDQAKDTYLLEKSNQPERDSLFTNIDRLTNLLPQYDVLESLSIEITKLKEEIHHLSVSATELENIKKNLVIQNEFVRNELSNLEDIELKLNTCEQELINKQSDIKNLEGLKISLENTIKIYKKQIELEEQFHAANQIYLKTNSSYIEMESAFFRGQAGILASNLEEGTPCPVCGSCTHPKLAEVTASIPTEEELTIYRQKVDTSRDFLQNISKSVAAVQIELKLATEQFIPSAKEYIEDIIKNTGGNEDIGNKPIYTPEMSVLLFQNIDDTFKRFRESMNLFHETLEKIKKQSLKKQNYKEALKDIENDIKAKEIKLVELNEHSSEKQLTLSVKLGEYNAIKANLTYQSKEEAAMDLKKWSDKLSVLKNAFTKAEEEYHNLNKEVASLKSLLTSTLEGIQVGIGAQRIAQEEFLAKLSECGFSQIENYRTSLLNEKELNLLREKLESYQDLLKKTQQDIKRLESETKDKAIEDLSILEQQKEILGEEKAGVEAAIEDIVSRLGSNVNTYKALNHTLIQSEAVQKEYLQMSLLSRTANGELAGKQKLAFEQYVQTTYFNQVLQEANKRLRIMTNSRYELIRREDSTDLRSQSGLEINVLDNYTGRQRSVKSLSGGESFKASLSLALGLSDVIQGYAGGVEIDTLFIDEGFGALDGESLDQALQTLVSLTAGNRLVGIISHVAELKERIDRQILIQKTSSGSSIKII